MIVNRGTDPVTLNTNTHLAHFSVASDLPSDEGTPLLPCCAAQSADSSPDEHRRAIIDAYLDKTCAHLSKETFEQLRLLLLEYHDVFSLTDEDQGFCDLSPHVIDTGDTEPIKQRTRRVPPHRLSALQDLLNNLLRKGIVRESNSPWSSPIVLVPKRDDSIRLCVDYRQLNKITRPDAYPLPRADDTIEAFAGCKVFTTLDLATGYWQIALSEDDCAKSAFTTPLGLYEFTVLPMGCINGPATFQRLMEKALRSLLQLPTPGKPVTRVFFDDIAVGAVDEPSSLGQIELVFQYLRSAGLKLRLTKCSLLQPQVAFLGYTISAGGIATSPDKIKKVVEWPTPRSVSEVRSFLGLANYYRKYIKHFAHIASPLVALTSKNVKFYWSKACDVAFALLTKRLTSAPVLGYPGFHHLTTQSPCSYIGLSKTA